MRQIRARIREKRGVDYTEEEIRELANVKLEKFLDPRGVRSDLLEQFQRARAASTAPRNFAFEDTTLYETHRGFIRWIRKLLQSAPEAVLQPEPADPGAAHPGGARTPRARSTMRCTTSSIHNLVLETTRLGIEVKNLKMRVESMSSRLDFDERRARALEGVVQYRPGAAVPLQPPAAGEPRSGESAGGDAVRAAHARAAGAVRGAGPASATDGRVERPARRRRAARAVKRRSTSRDPGEASRSAQTPRRIREARGRRPALRRRHQRRRGAARALHRRAALPARRGRGRDDLRARLRHLAERAAGRRRAGQRRRRCGGFPSTHERGAARVRPALGARLQAAALDRRRARLARERGPGEPGADRLPRAPDAVRLRHLLQLSLLPRVARRAAAAPPRRSSCRRPSAIRRSALAIFGPIFRGVRAVMYNSPEERAMIQAVAGNPTVPGVVVGVGSDVPERSRRGALPAQVRHQPAVRDLHRPHRREQGLQASCSSTSSATRATFPRGLDLVLDRQRR